MAEIGRWNGHVFEVSPEIVHSFTDLTVKGSAETEDKALSDGQKIVSLKNGKPAEISLTVHLDTRFGCEDIRSEAVALVQEAQAGASDYFYLGDKKLLPCQMMLISAEVSQITLTPGSVWIRCEVKLSMKQSEKRDGSSGSSGGGSGGNAASKQTYKVQIPGMSILTVEASGVQDAITKTCGKWTGTVLVNNVSYKVTKGVIDKEDQYKAVIEARLQNPATLTALQKAKADIVRITSNVEAAREASAKTKDQTRITPGEQPKAVTTTVPTPSPRPRPVGWTSPLPPPSPQTITNGDPRPIEPAPPAGGE